MKYYSLLLLTLLLSVSAIYAQKQIPPEGGEPKDFKLPPTQTFALDNGLKATLVEYGNVPKVVVSLVVQTGNVHEGPEQVWLADLLGNLLKEGTKNRSAEALSQAVARMGGELSVSVGSNTTTVSSTVLFEVGPELVALLAEVVAQPALPASEINRLKNDLKRDLNVRLAEPGSQAYAEFYAITYPDEPYGRVFPTEAMIDTYTVSMVKDFYDKNFGAQRSHVYVSGKFDAPAMKEAITSAFGDWKEGPSADLPTIKAVASNQVKVLDRPDAPQSTIMMGMPVADPSNADYTALETMNTLLGGSFGSRITSNIREDKGYTYSPYSSINTEYRTAVWAESADVTTEHTGASLKEIMGEIKRLQEEAPTQEELEGFQNYQAGIFVLRNSSPEGIISQLRFMDLHQLDSTYLENKVENIYQVKPQDVQKMAQEYLDVKNMTVVIVGDKAKVNNQLQQINLEPEQK